MSDNEDYFCYECSKKYPDFHKYQAHVKFKHSEPRSDAPKGDKKMHEAEIFELEDRIYAHFGQLAEKYNDRLPERQPADDSQRFLGQANYLTNYIVRTPYQNQIKVDVELPENFTYAPLNELTIGDQFIESTIQEINFEIKKLVQKLESQRNKWQFMDPYDAKANEGDQFSVMNINKLLQNYKKRGINLKYKQLTVFLIWIGRICKPDSFRIFYCLLVAYAISYYNFIWQEYDEPKKCKDLHSWRQFVQKTKKKCSEIDKQRTQQENKKWIKNFKFDEANTLNIEKQDLQRLLDLYEKWVESMDVLSKSGSSRELKNKKKKKESQVQEPKKQIKVQGCIKNIKVEEHDGE